MSTKETKSPIKFDEVLNRRRPTYDQKFSTEQIEQAILQFPQAHSPEALKEKEEAKNKKKRLTAERRRLAAYRFLCRQEQVKRWIEDIFETPLQTDLVTAIRDGVILCKLINRIVPNLINKIHPRGSPHFLLMENIEMFTRSCRNLGITKQDLFIAIDLFERKNIPKVVNCLLLLEAFAVKKGFEIQLQPIEKLEMPDFSALLIEDAEKMLFQNGQKSGESGLENNLLGLEELNLNKSMSKLNKDGELIHMEIDELEALRLKEEQERLKKQGELINLEIDEIEALRLKEEQERLRKEGELIHMEIDEIEALRLKEEQERLKKEGELIHMEIDEIEALRLKEEQERLKKEGELINLEIDEIEALRLKEEQERLRKEGELIHVEIDEIEALRLKEEQEKLRKEGELIHMEIDEIEALRLKEEQEKLKKEEELIHTEIAEIDHLKLKDEKPKVDELVNVEINEVDPLKLKEEKPKVDELVNVEINEIDPLKLKGEEKPKVDELVNVEINEVDPLKLKEEEKPQVDELVNVEINEVDPLKLKEEEKPQVEELTHTEINEVEPIKLKEEETKKVEEVHVEQSPKEEEASDEEIKEPKVPTKSKSARKLNFDPPKKEKKERKPLIPSGPPRHSSFATASSLAKAKNPSAQPMAVKEEKPKEPEKYVPVIGDEIDTLLAKFVNQEDQTALQAKHVNRISLGKYKLGVQIVVLKIANGHLVARVGGGWIHFEEFVAKYHTLYQRSLPSLPTRSASTSIIDSSSLSTSVPTPLSNKDSSWHRVQTVSASSSLNLKRNMSLRRFSGSEYKIKKNTYTTPVTPTNGVTQNFSSPPSPNPPSYALNLLTPQPQKRRAPLIQKKNSIATTQGKKPVWRG